jgi:hypothetical protein
VHDRIRRRLAHGELDVVRPSDPVVLGVPSCGATDLAHTVGDGGDDQLDHGGLATVLLLRAHVAPPAG